MAGKRNEDLVRKLYVDLPNRRDLAAAVTLVAPDVEANWPGGRQARGPEAWVGLRSELLAGIPDLEAALEELIVIGERGAWRVRWRGTQDGSPATGVAVIMGRFRNGQLAAEWVTHDGSLRPRCPAA